MYVWVGFCALNQQQAAYGSFRSRYRMLHRSFILFLPLYFLLLLLPMLGEHQGGSVSHPRAAQHEQQPFGSRFVVSRLKFNPFLSRPSSSCHSGSRFSLLFSLYLLLFLFFGAPRRARPLPTPTNRGDPQLRRRRKHACRLTLTGSILRFWLKHILGSPLPPLNAHQGPLLLPRTQLVGRESKLAVLWRAAFVCLPCPIRPRSHLPGLFFCLFGSWLYHEAMGGSGGGGVEEERIKGRHVISPPITCPMTASSPFYPLLHTHTICWLLCVGPTRPLRVCTCMCMCVASENLRPLSIKPCRLALWR